MPTASRQSKHELEYLIACLTPPLRLRNTAFVLQDLKNIYKLFIFIFLLYI